MLDVPMEEPFSKSFKDLYLFEIKTSLKSSLSRIADILRS